MNKVAGVILTFCRPDYYKRSLKSLEECYNTNEIDWFVYQDGYSGYPKQKLGYKLLKQENIYKNIEVTKASNLNIKEHFINENNKGINYQLIQSTKLFDKGYETLFIFEDDIIVSPYYLNLLYNCSIQYPTSVAMFFSIKRKEKGKDRFKVLVKSKVPRLWGFYLTKQCWELLKDTPIYNPEKRTPYYDVPLSIAIRQKTDGKYESVVSRAINIGKVGILSTNDKTWKRRELDKQTKEIIFEEDKTLREFIIK